MEAKKLEEASGEKTGSAPKVFVEARLRTLPVMKDVKVSEEFRDVLNTAVEDMVIKAVSRMKANGRNTLKSQDL